VVPRGPMMLGYRTAHPSIRRSTPSLTSRPPLAARAGHRRSSFLRARRFDSVSCDREVAPHSQCLGSRRARSARSDRFNSDPLRPTRVARAALPPRQRSAGFRPPSTSRVLVHGLDSKSRAVGFESLAVCFARFVAGRRVATEPLGDAQP
jgi:hypothetical protein